MFCETVVLLSQQKPDDTIEIDLDLDELDATSAELKARDQMEWVRLVNGIRNMAEETCVKRIGVYLKRGKLLRELFAVYKINSVGDLL